MVDSPFGSSNNIGTFLSTVNPDGEVQPARKDAPLDVEDAAKHALQLLGHGPMPMDDLAQKLNLSAEQISRVVSYLVDMDMAKVETGGGQEVQLTEYSAHALKFFKIA